MHQASIFCQKKYLNINYCVLWHYLVLSTLLAYKCTNNGDTICEGFGTTFERDIAVRSCGNEKLLVIVWSK